MISKMIIDIVLYIITYITIKLLILLGLDFDTIKLLFYTIWTFTSFYTWIQYYYFNYDLFIIFVPIFINTINCTYIYELINYRPDTSHTIHHILTVILQTISWYSNFETNTGYCLLFNTAHLGFFSSILSSCVTIATKKNSKNLAIIKQIYLYSYLLAKIGGTILYYFLLYYYDLFDYKFLYIFILYGLVHLLQIYFCYLVYIKIKRTKALHH